MAEQIAQAGGSGTHQRQRFRILVVDDHHLVRSTLRSLLAQQPDWRIFEAANGQLAVDQILEIRPDVVVMDIVMPVMSGIEAALAASRLGLRTLLATNNLDRNGRRAVIDLLAGWRVGAIVVSHDRELLETMDTIVELTSLGATRYGGNWSLIHEKAARH